LGVDEESEDESGVDEGLPELRCWIQMMKWMRITKFPWKLRNSLDQKLVEELFRSHPFKGVKGRIVSKGIV
jgi:hypothetical protein